MVKRMTAPDIDLDALHQRFVASMKSPEAGDSTQGEQK